MKIKHFFYILLILSLSISLGCSEHKNAAPKAEFGVMDLSDWNFETDGCIKLDGEWELYWDKLLTPTELNLGSYPIKTGVIHVPLLWNDQLINETSLNGKGFATYRLFIQFNNAHKLYSFKIGRIETAYKMWINSKLVIQHGTVGTSESEAHPRWCPSEVYFQTDSSILEIVMQVSNFKNRKGGIAESMMMGLPNQISDYGEKTRAYIVFLLGVLLIMAAYYFGLFVLSREDFSPLFFGLVCLFAAINSLTIGEIWLVKIFPKLEWEIILKISYISNLLRLSSFVAYLSVLYRREIAKKIVWIITGVSIALSVFVIVTSAQIYTYLQTYIQILTVITFLYLLFGLVAAAVRKREAAIYSIIGTLLLFATFINDILNENQLIDTTYLVPVGMFIFIFFQSFILSMRFSKSFVSEKKLTKSFSALDRIKNELLASSSHQLFIPLKIVVDNIEAEKGFLIVEHDNKWVLAAKATKIDSQSENIPYVPIEQIPDYKPLLLPHTIVNHVIKTKSTLLLGDAFLDGGYIIDDYIHNNQTKSVICIPLINNEILKGVLYLEDNRNANAFTQEIITILDLLSSQLSTLIENAKIYQEVDNLNKTLEQKVEERTKVIKEQNHILVEQTEKIEAQNKLLLEKQQVLEDTIDIAEEQRSELDKKNKNITDSILYAERIQKSIFPSEEHIKGLLPNSFILFKPKDILSGDFYWLEYVSNDDVNTTYVNHLFEESNYKGEQPPEKGKIIVAAADCTGHGVPGALLSIVGNHLLNYAVKELHCTKPSEILNLIEEGFIAKLSTKDTIVQDGMDIGLLCYDIENQRLQYAGAQNPLYLVRDGEIMVIEGDKFTIGGVSRKEEWHYKRFTNNELEVKKGDLVYLFTDGYIDQFGGPKLRKFMFSAFRKLLLNIWQEPIEKQKQILLEEFEKWKGNFVQIDDILVIGIQF